MARLRTIDELHEMALDHAKFMLVGDAGGQVLPTFWIQFDNGPGEMIVTPWSDEAEKLAVVEMIRGRLKDPHARNYAFVSEVWMAAETVGRPNHLPPSERPDRHEMVIVHAFNRASGNVKVYHTRRDAKGVVQSLDEDKKCVDFKGRMFNLFQEEKSQYGVVRRGVITGDAKITRTPLNRCLDCGHVVSAGAPTPDTPDDSTPRPGDLAICTNCAHVMIYANDLTVRAPTDAEMVEIAGDPDMVRAVNAIADFNKRERGVG